MYSVRSMYQHLGNEDRVQKYKELWCAKLPLKIKIFMWLVSQDAILTKDNMVKRKWKGDERCVFYGDKETSMHLIFECVNAKGIWSVIVFAFGVTCRPVNFEQYCIWAYLRVERFTWWD